MEDERIKQELFDGNNYDNWKFLMEIILDEKELLYLVKTPFEELESLLTEDSEEETAAKARLRKEKIT